MFATQNNKKSFAEPQSKKADSVVPQTTVSEANPLWQSLALNSPGRPLDETTRRFMEPRFGHDFSHVRVHDDSTSATSAEAFHAKAYTVGPHIVFGAGMYQPASSDGQRLLAHELAHTVQQHSGDRLVQRTPDDFRVSQVQPDPVARTRGMSDRFFFEIEQATFRTTVPEEAAERARLVAWATAHRGQHVRLIGRASQEGTSGGNAELARQRTATVAAILTAGGVIVDGRDIDATYAQQAVEYRFYRSVEIVAGSPTCNNFTPTQQTQDVTDCEAAFTAAHTRATSIVNAAMSRLRPARDTAPAATQPNTPAPPRDSRDTILNLRFPGVPRSTLLPLFESIVTRLGEVAAAAGHTCNHRCANGCERAASAGPGGGLSLCAPFYIPGFSGALSADERVFLVLHETTHSAVVPGSSPAQSVGIDFAYLTTRMFGVLTGSEALNNADSYVMTFLALAESAANAPGVASSRGSAPADTLSLTTPPAETIDRNRTARRALGFAESWLNYSAFWAPSLYDYINASLTTWSTPDSLGHAMLELWTAPFQLSHPGNSGLSAARTARVTPFQTAVAGRGFTTPPTTTHATEQDRTRVAGIYDRYSRMLSLLDRALTVSQAASGDGSWSTAGGLPGLGTNVQLADSFFTAFNTADQTRHVIRLMARAMSDVGTLWVEAYVEGADGVRQLRGLGP